MIIQNRDINEPFSSSAQRHGTCYESGFKPFTVRTNMWPTKLQVFLLISSLAQVLLAETDGVLLVAEFRTNNTQDKTNVS
jgi:hypothetical protein